MIIGVIPSRYASTRFPGKPLADICGKPMIWWVYNQCKKAKCLDAVYVATDDDRIYKTCIEYNMDVIMTSKECKTGTDRVAEVAQKIDADLYINIQGDEPLINPEEIEEVAHIFTDSNVYFGSLRYEINDLNEIQSENVVKIVVDYNQDALYFSRSVIPSNIKDGKRAKVFKHIGIYGFKKHFLMEYVKLPQSELELGEGVEAMRAIEYGYKMRVHETKHRSIGVDTQDDLRMVEKVISQKYSEMVL